MSESVLIRDHAAPSRRVVGEILAGAGGGMPGAAVLPSGAAPQERPALEAIQRIHP